MEAVKKCQHVNYIFHLHLRLLYPQAIPLALCHLSLVSALLVFEANVNELVCRCYSFSS